MSRATQEEQPNRRWIIINGQVDETMNTWPAEINQQASHSGVLGFEDEGSSLVNKSVDVVFAAFTNHALELFGKVGAVDVCLVGDCRWRWRRLEPIISLGSRSSRRIPGVVSTGTWFMDGPHGASAVARAGAPVISTTVLGTRGGVAERSIVFPIRLSVGVGRIASKSGGIFSSLLFPFAFANEVKIKRFGAVLERSNRSDVAKCCGGLHLANVTQPVIVAVVGEVRLNKTHHLMGFDDSLVASLHGGDKLLEVRMKLENVPAESLEVK